MSKVSVLVVEDNEDMRTAVASFLRDEGYKVDEAASAEEVIDKHMYQQKDVAIVDISLPSMTGLELTRHMRANGFTEAVIGLTARDTVDDKINGLKIGMNDYIVKPFDLRELEARISAQIRTIGAHNDLNTVETKSFVIEPKRHKFYKNNKQIRLTAVEFRIMLKLMQFNHATVSTTDLIEFAWGDDALFSNPPIRIHISNLRNKIGDNDLSIINTIPGIGYMLQD